MGLDVWRFSTGEKKMCWLLDKGRPKMTASLESHADQHRETRLQEKR